MKNKIKKVSDKKQKGNLFMRFFEWLEDKFRSMGKFYGIIFGFAVPFFLSRTQIDHVISYSFMRLDAAFFHFTGDTYRIANTVASSLVVLVLLCFAISLVFYPKTASIIEYVFHTLFLIRAVWVPFKAVKSRVYVAISVLFLIYKISFAIYVYQKKKFYRNSQKKKILDGEFGQFVTHSVPEDEAKRNLEFLDALSNSEREISSTQREFGELITDDELLKNPGKRPDDYDDYLTKTAEEPLALNVLGKSAEQLRSAEFSELITDLDQAKKPAVGKRELKSDEFDELISNLDSQKTTRKDTEKKGEMYSEEFSSLITNLDSKSEYKAKQKEKNKKKFGFNLNYHGDVYDELIVSNQLDMTKTPSKSKKEASYNTDGFIMDTGEYSQHKKKGKKRSQSVYKRDDTDGLVIPDPTKTTDLKPGESVREVKQYTDYVVSEENVSTKKGSQRKNKSLNSDTRNTFVAHDYEELITSSPQQQAPSRYMKGFVPSREQIEKNERSRNTGQNNESAEKKTVNTNKKQDDSEPEFDLGIRRPSSKDKTHETNGNRRVKQQDKKKFLDDDSESFIL